jgi:hypothetical protein
MLEVKVTLAIAVPTRKNAPRLPARTVATSVNFRQGPQIVETPHAASDQKANRRRSTDSKINTKKSENEMGRHEHLRNLRNLRLAFLSVRLNPM